MQTLGLVANVYNEIHALPGWLETHLAVFDDIRIYHAGPGGAYSDDGTIELLEKWRIPITFGSIDEGFGVTRTKAIRSSPCDWVMLLDADERFYATHRTMSVSGEATTHSEVDTILQSYDFSGVRLPNWENLATLGDKLRVTQDGAYSQGSQLRELIELELDAIVTVRRHWHDFSFRRPTQNWFIDPDWQMRCMRNKDSIYFDPSKRMHEQLLGAASCYRADTYRGPFFDHFHFTFKRMEQKQRAHDVAIYDAIHKGERPPTKEEFQNVRTS